MAVAMDAIESSRFSTADLPPGARLAAYREVLRTTGNFEVEALGEEFDFSASAFALPSLGVAQIASSAVRVARTRETEAPARDLGLAVFHEGTVTATQRGRNVTLSNGGAYLFSIHEPLVMERSASRVADYSMLSADLGPAVANLEDALLAPIAIDSEPIRLLTSYADLLFANGMPASTEARRIAVGHIHDLVALAVGATREGAEMAKGRGLRAARRAELYARAVRLIALRFEDPDLTPGEMAQQLRVSPRHLQEIFAERGETVMARLWDERVSRAARLLSAPEAADRSITDIAFACGFNDSSHFGRVFAARLGMPPSRWRKQARDQAAGATSELLLQPVAA